MEKKVLVQLESIKQEAILAVNERDVTESR